MGSFFSREKYTVLYEKTQKIFQEVLYYEEAEMDREAHYLGRLFEAGRSVQRHQLDDVGVLPVRGVRYPPH